MSEVGPSMEGQVSNGNGQQHDDDGANCKLFIGGISWETEDVAFHEAFKVFGDITDCIIMRNPAGKSRGFGFVTFANSTAVNACLAEAIVLDGRTLDTKLAVPKGDHDSTTRRKEVQTHRKTCKIFIGGIAPDTTKEDLDNHFGTYGTITDSIVMTDRVTSRSRGFGFVTFEKEESVDKLCEDTHEISGKQVDVKKAIPKDDQDHPGRRGGDRGFDQRGRGYDDRRGGDRRGYDDRGGRGYDRGGDRGYDRGYDRGGGGGYDRGGGGGYDRGYDRQRGYDRRDDRGYGGHGGSGYGGERGGYGGGGGGGGGYGGDRGAKGGFNQDRGEDGRSDGGGSWRR